MAVPSQFFRSALAPSRLRVGGRILLALLLIGAAALWWTHHGALDLDALRDLLRHHPAAPLLFLAMHILASLLFFPRSAMAALAGLVFGVWWGGVLAALGGALGASTGFLAARYLNDGSVSLDEGTRLGGARLGGARLGEVLARIERGGWRAVAMLRFMPVLPHSAVNYALGLTRLPLGAYALGSLLGQLPTTIAFVQFGAAGDRAAAGHPGWLVPTAIGLTLLTLSTVLPKVGPRLWERFGLGRPQLP